MTLEPGYWGNQFRLAHAAWGEERLRALSQKGRGRLLHPRSELQRIGHPWEETQHPPDTKTVREGERLAQGSAYTFQPADGQLMRAISKTSAIVDPEHAVAPGETHSEPDAAVNLKERGRVGESICRVRGIQESRDADPNQTGPIEPAPALETERRDPAGSSAFSPPGTAP